MKSWLKTQHSKTKIMSSSPITSWQIGGGEVKTVQISFLGPKINADGDWGHEIKSCLLLGRKVMTELDSIFKSRDITLLTKFHIVKAMVFLVVTNGCESWAIKKAEHWKINAFKLWSWRTLESPMDCYEIKPVNLKGNQLWIFIGRTDAEAEAPILWPMMQNWKRLWC